ncbi:hypothetical protein GCK72_025036 [Caenorhabditis remanei]|uniref:Uncharacterized protein n=1 Tax=Caenorhabditis remanei TaxID=31234 RepID=A0A6A5G214_CAERE|nr:hypothetical protein GCK72_025036 [Caenorhabditis remanei]KAF1748569.1 hypothetical protein GCK72_025036 [Caenorhabditis remanei]
MNTLLIFTSLSALFLSASAQQWSAQQLAAYRQQQYFNWQSISYRNTFVEVRSKLVLRSNRVAQPEANNNTNHLKHAKRLKH